MEWYGNNYKKLFLIPLALLIISIAIIGFTIANTGTFVKKGVTLSGGVSATFSTSDSLTVDSLEENMRILFPDADIVARTINSFGAQPSFVVDAADINPDPQTASDMLQAGLENTYSVNSISIETTGPSLGAAFFLQTISGILLAFLWMGWVVYLYFGDGLPRKIVFALINIILSVLVVNGIFSGVGGAVVLAIIVLAVMVGYFFFSIPSGAVILAAASTILFTLAVINVIGVRLSTAGVAAFLMLIGYSVDTDILLSTRVLKRQNGTLWQRVFGAFKTGITMQITTTVAVLVAFLLTSSDVIRQIMLILLVGMVGDVIFTWLQNAGIIYWYVSREKPKQKVVAEKVSEEKAPIRKEKLGKRRLRRKRL